MSGWVWLGLYLAGMGGSWPTLVRSCLRAMESEFSVQMNSSDKAAAFSFAVMAALVWPGSLLMRWLYRLAGRGGSLTTDREKALAAEERAVRAEVELRRARQAAQREGLPWPGNQEL